MKINDDVLHRWREAWSTGLWAAPWSRVIADVTAAQAAWKPSPQRHSIWQIVAHVVFWREEAARRIRGQGKTPDDQVAPLNFPQPDAPTDAAWSALRDRFETTHRLIEAAASEHPTTDPHLSCLLAHDAYHVGQIAYLRALQGLPSCE